MSTIQEKGVDDVANDTSMIQATLDWYPLLRQVNQLGRRARINTVNVSATANSLAGRSALAIGENCVR